MFANKTLSWILVKNIGLMLGIILCTSLLISFIGNKITKTSTAISANKQLSMQLAMRNALLATIHTNYEEVRMHEQAMRRALLPADDILEFTGALESLGTKHNVLQKFTFDTPVSTDTTFGTPPKTLTKINFTLSFPANIFIAKAYLKDFEQLPYFTKIESITVESDGKSGWQNMSTILIRATLFTELSETTQ